MNPRNAALSHEAARADAVAPDAVVPAAGDVPDAVVAEGATRPDAVVAQSPVPGAAVPSDAVPHAAVPSAAVQPRTLAAAGVTLAYGDRVVSEGLDLTITPGAVTAIVGANGCGKSTLLRALARLLAPQQGEVLLDGEPVRKRHTKEVARIVGLLPQSPIAPEGIAVADLVGRGRYPHQRAFAGWSAADYAAVADALAATDTTDLADRAVDELSGGQRQRVWIAMALAQQTDILLLDEPTTFLDVAHQVEVLDLLTDLNHERGTTIVMVLHDLNMAARYADVLVTMREGAVHSVGVPSEIVTAQLVEEVFGMRSQVIPDPVSGKPLVLPAGRHHGG